MRPSNANMSQRPAMTQKQRKAAQKIIRPIQYPKLKVIALFDSIIFLIVFVGMFVLKFEQRTVIYDIYIGVALFGKILLGLIWYGQKSLKQLRVYMAWRYLYNAGLLGVPTVLFDYFSRSYPLNYLVVLAAVAVSELIMLLVYSTSLC